MGWKGEEPQRQVQYSHEKFAEPGAVLGDAGSPRKAKQKLIILGVLGNKFCFVFFCSSSSIQTFLAFILVYSQLTMLW